MFNMTNFSENNSNSGAINDFLVLVYRENAAFVPDILKCCLYDVKLVSVAPGYGGPI